MKIGIVSDSHGDVDRLSRAMEIFRAHQTDAIVHCGDVGSSECVRLLSDAGCDVYMVAGNVDRRVRELSLLAEQLGIRFSCEVVQVPFAEGRFLVAAHGDDEKILGELIHEHQFPYVCHGHTHKRRDERIENVRVINPGALHNAKVPTVAVLDTDTDMLEHVVVP